jgi:hypothetical protein
MQEPVRSSGSIELQLLCGRSMGNSNSACSYKLVMVASRLATGLLMFLVMTHVSHLAFAASQVPALAWQLERAANVINMSPTCRGQNPR